ncbi:OTU-domain-containing protein [Wallemia mellicola]|nr:OTU-domain-containing protein [Wallemia mellicola]
MGPLPLRRQVALEEMEFNRCRSPSDPYVAQQSRTRYAHRLLRHLPNDIDLDSYCMTVYPSELLTLFDETSAVSLVSHTQNIRDHEEYRDWVYIGQSVAMLLIPSRYKCRLFDKFESLNYTLELASYKRTFIKGNHITFMAVLVHCLESIACNAVRIQAYGLKAPIKLLTKLLTFHSHHPLRSTNNFDIGITENSNVRGLSLLKGKGPRTETFPICSPAANGYGTVRLRTKISQKFEDTHAPGKQTVVTKMYSKIAHVIKSLGSKHPLYKAKSMSVLKHRFEVAKQNFDKIYHKPPKAIQGFRIEATVHATNLTWALELVHDHKLLDSKTYDQRYKLGVLRPSNYVYNVRRLINKVEELKLMKGSSSAKASDEKNKVIADVWQSLGWNKFKWTVTRHSNIDAWWNDRLTRREFEQSARCNRAAFFNDTDNCRTFFDLSRQVQFCPKCGNNIYRYRGKTRFLLKCVNFNCFYQMGKKSCIAMWNDLLNGRSGRFYEGVIERTIEANYPGPTPSVEGSSSDSSSCPPLHDTSPEPSCPSLYDTSPEPCREGSVIELSSDGSEGRPERSRKRSIIVIDSDSSEDSPRSRKRMHLEEESCQSPVPESGG